MGRTGSEMFGRDEIMRGDRGPEKIAESSFVLPAAAGERAGRLGGVGLRIAGPEQEHAPARRPRNDHRPIAISKMPSQREKRKGLRTIINESV